MHAHREQRALAQHPLVASVELDLGDGEAMTEMEGAVHVRVREGAEPFGLRFTLCWRGSVDFE